MRSNVQHPTREGMVSVVLPTFNRSRQLFKAVRSALDQTYANLEVLVVDDGSIDDTREAIGRLNDARVRYLWQENAGLPAARNLGMVRAQGDYIAFLDDDDTWLPWKIEAQVAVLSAFPAAGMVWTDYAGVDAQGRVLHPRHLRMRFSAYSYLDLDREFVERRLLERLWSACPPSLVGTRCYAGSMYRWMFMGSLAPDPTVLLRRGRREATGEFDLVFSAGYDFFLRACEHGDVAFLDAASTHCQITGEDHLSGPARRVIEARNNLGAIEKALASSSAAVALPEALVRERLARCHHWIGREELLYDPRSARRHLAVVLRSGRLVRRDVQRNACLLFGLSYLPPRAFLGLKRVRGVVRRSLAIVGAGRARLGRLRA